MISWTEGIDSIKEYLVRIEIPDSYGTGFLIARAQRQDREEVVIATAYHVIEHANKWAEIIHIVHPISGKDVMLAPSNRIVIANPAKDLALLQFSSDPLPFPSKTPHILGVPIKSTVQPGLQIGWCGFPNMVPDAICFYSGHVSAFVEGDDILVDGVAINGVSGGPAMMRQDDAAVVVGLVAAYVPNVATGQVLPGMSVVRNIAPFVDFMAKQAAQGAKP